MSDENKRGIFPTTAWSRIAAAKDPTHPRFREAMNWLLTSYWWPVFCHLRAAKHAPEQATELADEFFLNFLQKNWVEPADVSRGRFRGLLCTMLDRFVATYLHRPSAQARFEKSHQSLDEWRRRDMRAYDPPVNETPKQAFHKAWKAETLERVRQDLKSYYEGLKDQEEWTRYQAFGAYHFAERSEDQPSHDELAKRFGLDLEQVHYALKTVKKRYERFIRQELLGQLGSEEEVEEAIRELLT
jgi:RNA polymerase sigma-70 factor (ECF subfamily)